MGQAVVDSETTVERRVLSIPSRGTYITVEPNQTAESYTAGLRQKCINILCLSAVYILLYVAVWILIYRKNRKKKVGAM